MAMDLTEEINVLSTRIKKTSGMIKTEEATKQAFIVPFIKALGYDVYDPLEVVPEYSADHGTKKGEKVDYAIIKDSEPIILIECKWCGINLDDIHASQLFRYFSVTEARVAVLTNGIIYRFFADLDKLNQMDTKSFLEIDISNPQKNLLSELHRFTKSNFDLAEIIPIAMELRYTREIRQLLSHQRIDPHEDFVRFFASRIFPGRLRGNVLEQFTDLTKKAFNQLVNNEINKRFNLAMDKPDESLKQQLDEQPQIKKETVHVEITEEELEGFQIIQDIIKETIALDRVSSRKNANYVSIVLDNNRRRSICQLYFYRNSKRIKIMDEKADGLESINEINDIRNYTERLIALVAKIDNLTKLVKKKVERLKDDSQGGGVSPWFQLPFDNVIYSCAKYYIRKRKHQDEKHIHYLANYIFDFHLQYSFWR